MLRLMIVDNIFDPNVVMVTMRLVRVLFVVVVVFIGRQVFVDMIVIMQGRLAIHFLMRCLALTVVVFVLVLIQRLTIVVVV